jgi:hypothetical protein
MARTQIKQTGLEPAIVASIESGGGGGGGDGFGSVGGNGASGAVRIIWGTGRAFPATNTADQ